MEVDDDGAGSGVAGGSVAAAVSAPLTPMQTEQLQALRVTMQGLVSSFRGLLGAAHVGATGRGDDDDEEEDDEDDNDGGGGEGSAKQKEAEQRDEEENGPLPSVRVSRQSYADLCADQHRRQLASSVHAHELVQAVESLLDLTAHLKRSYVLHDRERIGAAVEEASALCTAQRELSEGALAGLAADMDEVARDLARSAQI